VRASAHGARVRERPRRMASHSLGWVSGWARTARVGRIQLPAHACACERSTARASLERPARVEGRPRAHPRATEAWRTGCGVAKGWDKKRAHRGGRARAEEVCTRVTWPFCRRLPGAPGRRPLMRDVIAPEITRRPRLAVFSDDAPKKSTGKLNVQKKEKGEGGGQGCGRPLICCEIFSC
jgi:hypothetical protein